jgi:hypothetical protein
MGLFQTGLEENIGNFFVTIPLGVWGVVRVAKGFYGTQRGYCEIIGRKSLLWAEFSSPESHLLLFFKS